MQKESGDLTITISSGTIIKIILLVLLVAFLFFLRDLVLVVLTAVAIASAIEPGIKWFVRYKIPRVIAVLTIYVIIGTLFFGLFYSFIPVLLNEVSNFLSVIPQYINSVDISGRLSDSAFLAPSQSVIQNFSLGDTIVQFQSALTNISGGIVNTVSVVFGGVLSFLFIIVFSFYFAAQERGISDFLRVISPLKHQKYVLDLWRRSQIKIGRWMQGQLLLGLIIGILVYLGLTILGVKYALLLAVIAAVFELIPVFGPVLAAVPAVALGFIDGGLSLALFIVGLYLIIQQFENHLIYPLVVTKVVGIPPLLVILALIIGAKLAGFLGILLSVPVATVIYEFVKDIQKDRDELLEKETSKSH